ALQVGQHRDVSPGRRRGLADLWKRRPCSAWAPWLKLSRATSKPASTMARARSGESVAGPSVQTILACRITLSRVVVGLRSAVVDADCRRGQRSEAPVGPPRSGVSHIA